MKRLAAGLTQSEVAARLEQSQSFVAKYEGGKRRLDVIEFMDIADAIGFDPAEFIGFIGRLRAADPSARGAKDPLPNQRVAP